MATRPLKKNATGLPRQFNVSVDELAAKGLDIEDLGTHRIIRVGQDITLLDPTVGSITVDLLRSYMRVSANDTTPDYLLSKLATGGTITVTEQNDGLAETVEIRNNFGFQYVFANQDPNVTATGITPVVALTTPAISAESGTNTFRARWQLRMVNSKQNTDGESNVYWTLDATSLTLDTNTARGTGVISFLGGGQGEQSVGAARFQFTGPGSLTLSADIARTAGNGAARINSIKLELWRVS